MDSSGPIQVARDAPDNIKEKLIFRNEDELETGMQKVKPLPFLDEEIHKSAQLIREFLPKAQQVNDSVPQKTLEIVETVIKEANTGETTLFKASDLLEQTADAFKYARRASCDDFRLKRKSEQKLREYDEMFKQVIEHRIGKRMNESQKAMKRCRELLEKAVKFAEDDRESLAERMENEDTDISGDQLDDISIAAQDSIKDERGELDMIKQQCERDITDIDQGLEQFHMKIELLESHKMSDLGRQQDRLRVNLSRQEEIRRELEELETSEMQLRHDIETRQKDLKHTSSAREAAKEEIEDWKKKVQGLKSRTDTALSIMRHMKDCTNLIMTNAKEKKREWKHRLTEMDLTSLLDYRDALLAQGVLYTVICSEAKKNSEMAAQRLEKLEEEKEEAAETGFTDIVVELSEKTDKFAKQAKQFEKQIQEMDGLMTEVTDKIQEVDGKIRQLSPSLQLDTLGNRCDARQLAMKQAFKKKSTEPVTFNSLGNYN